MILNLLPTERIDVGDEMAAHSIRVDELKHACLLAHFVASSIFAKYRRVDVDGPLIWAELNCEVSKYLVVKAVLAAQHLVNQSEECAGLGALDDAMIVGAGHHHHLADAEPRKSFGGHRLILGRVLDRAGRDNHSLTRHQSRVRSGSADRAGISQADSRALKVSDLKLAGARALDHIVVCIEQLAKLELVSAFDIRNKQRA